MEEPMFPNVSLANTVTLFRPSGPVNVMLLQLERDVLAVVFNLYQHLSTPLASEYVKLSEIFVK